MILVSFGSMHRAAFNTGHKLSGQNEISICYHQSHSSKYANKAQPLTQTASERVKVREVQDEGKPSRSCGKIETKEFRSCFGCAAHSIFSHFPISVCHFSSFVLSILFVLYVRPHGAMLMRALLQTLIVLWIGRSEVVFIVFRKKSHNRKFILFCCVVLPFHG